MRILGLVHVRPHFGHIRFAGCSRLQALGKSDDSWSGLHFCGLPTLYCAPCAAGECRRSRCNDPVSAATGRALAVAAHGGPAAGAGPDRPGAGGGGCGVGAIGPQSRHQGDTPEAGAGRETHYPGGGLCWGWGERPC